MKKILVKNSVGQIIFEKEYRNMPSIKKIRADLKKVGILLPEKSKDFNGCVYVGEPTTRIEYNHILAYIGDKLSKIAIR